MPMEKPQGAPVILTAAALERLKETLPARMYAKLVRSQKPITKAKNSSSSRSLGHCTSGRTIKDRQTGNEISYEKYIAHRKWQETHPVSGGKPGTNQWAHDVLYCPRASCDHLSSSATRAFRETAREILGIVRVNTTWALKDAVPVTYNNQPAFCRIADLLYRDTADSIWVLIPRGIENTLITGTARLVTYDGKISVQDREF